MPTYNRLTREQRYSIETMNDSGYGPTVIARTIGVHPSTVSRELRRLGDEVPYCYVAADQHAKDCQGKGQSIDESLLAIVEAKLREERNRPTKRLLS